MARCGSFCHILVRFGPLPSLVRFWHDWASLGPLGPLWFMLVHFGYLPDSDSLIFLIAVGTKVAITEWLHTAVRVTSEGRWLRPPFLSSGTWTACRSRWCLEPSVGLARARSACLFPVARSCRGVGWVSAVAGRRAGAADLRWGAPLKRKEN